MGRWRRHGGSWSEGREGVASRWIGPRQTTVPPLFSRLSPKTSPAWSSCCWTTEQTSRRRTTTGSHPLLVSAQKGNPKVTEILLEKRADINKASKRGQTPLFMAALYGSKEVVVTLLAAGADKAVSTATGLTALSIARERVFDEIAALLE